MKIDVPVSPYIADLGGVSDVVLSLAGAAPAKNLRLTTVVPREPQYERAKLRMEKTDLQVMAEVGFSGVAEVKAKAGVETHYFLSDLVITVQLDNPDPDSIITSATYGLGFRIGIIAFDVDVSFTASMASLAAAASLNMAKTSYQVDTIGLGLEALSAVKPLINNVSGPFNVETLETIGAINYELGKLIVDKGNTMQPGVMRVTVDTDRLGSALSDGSVNRFDSVIKGQIFALERAYRDKTGNEAIADAEKVPEENINAEVVCQTYEQVLGIDLQQKPQAILRVSETINQILWAGR
jgi:hypothetical protein